MNHAMIDIETLSTKPDAAVLSIGVAIFNDTQVIATDGWAFDITNLHGHIDPDTIAWWMKQGDAAREFSFTGKILAGSAAVLLKTTLAQHDVQEVWANDPSFDCVILREWWDRVRQTAALGNFPWKFYNERSYRTIVAEAERLSYDPKAAKGFYVAHNPIDDAAAQARVVIEARRMLGMQR